MSCGKSVCIVFPQCLWTQQMKQQVVQSKNKEMRIPTSTSREFGGGGSFDWHCCPKLDAHYTQEAQKKRQSCRWQVVQQFHNTKRKIPTFISLAANSWIPLAWWFTAFYHSLVLKGEFQLQGLGLTRVILNSHQLQCSSFFYVNYYYNFFIFCWWQDKRSKRKLELHNPLTNI